MFSEGKFHGGPRENQEAPVDYLAKEEIRKTRSRNTDRQRVCNGFPMVEYAAIRCNSMQFLFRPTQMYQVRTCTYCNALLPNSKA